MHILFADILKSPTGIDKITNQYWPNRQPVFPWYTISLILDGDLANYGWRFGQ